MSDSEKKLPEDTPGAPRRTRRGLPDLGALFEDVDSQAITAQKPAASQQGFLDFALPALKEPVESQAAEAVEEKPVDSTDDLAAIALKPTRRGANLRNADLSALFGDEKSPDATKEEQPAEGTGIGAADSSAAEARPRRRDSAAVLELLGGEKQEQHAQPAAPRIRQLDLGKSSLFSEETESGSDEIQLEFPAELQTYLSPDLWRKLNGSSVARGAMFNALERVRSVLYLVSTFIPSHLVQEKMRRPVAGLVSGQILRGSLLFSDVSGFTPLSERLATLGPEGAERVTAIMNQYFATMLEIISWSGGVLIKFAGDAMLVYFPEQENGEHVGWAVRAGQRMLRAMKNLAQIETPKGAVTLQMKIGLASGEFLAASVGSEKRMEYFVTGSAVTQTMGAEGKTTSGGQLVVNAQTAQQLGDALVQKKLPDEYYLLKPGSEHEIDDFEIKAEIRRGRGAVPWNASQHAILAQIEVALRQIQALKPYLAPELVERVVVHARRRQVDSEYRPTTVMFVNFTGPETLLDLWGTAGAQRVTSILNAYFSSMQDVIARYGGIISRVDPYSKGTKMLVLFGAPVAHEDDPQRAVSSALAMNAELEVLDDTWRRKFARYLPTEFTSPLVQHRMGITFGETFAGQVGSTTRREYTVMGDEVNLAARLMSAAEMGQILIEQQVQKTVADYFVLNALPPMRVKGKSRSISVFQVAGPRDDTLAIRASRRGQLVGREAELAQAGQLLDQALGGSGSLLELLGPAGIGKSHLADELINRSKQKNALNLFVNCRAYNSEAPYSAWSTLLRAMAGVTSIDYNPRIHYAKLRSLLASLELPEGSLPILAALMGLSRKDVEDTPAANNDAYAAKDRPSGKQAQRETPEGSSAGEEQSLDFIRDGRLKRRGSTLDLFQDLDRQRASDAGQVWIQLSEQLSERERNELYETVWKLLARLANKRPVVIFIEDAHWLDKQSLHLLQYLSKRIQEIPLFLILACRGDALPISSEPAGNLELGTQVVLGPMNQQGSTALVAHILVSDLAEVIFEQSGGNPLYIDEITRWFKRTRNISANELRSVMQTSNILQKLILSGLESLPEMQREIARIAAVIGNEFRTGEVQALLASRVDAVTLSNHLRALTHERLFCLEEAGADARYAFQQTLVRDILYNSLPHEQRRDYHARLAEYLSKAPSSRRLAQARILAALDGVARNPAQEAEKIAFHYEQSEQWLPAAQQYLEAGKQALQLELPAKALEFYSQGLACLEKLSGESLSPEVQQLWFEIALDKGDLALTSGQYLAATLAYETAQSKLPAGAPVEQETELVYRLALTLPTQNKSSDAIKGLQQLLKHPQTGSNPAVASAMAWLLWRSGKDDAARWIRKARSMVRKDNRLWAAQVDAMLADLAGYWQVAHKAFMTLQQPDRAAVAVLRAGDRMLAKGELKKALQRYQQAESLWRSQSLETNGLSLALYQQAGVYWNMNNLEETQRLLEQSLAALPQSAPALQVSGSVVIQRALKTIGVTKSGITKGGAARSRRLPVWNWQTHDDNLRISILFQA